MRYTIELWRVACMISISKDWLWSDNGSTHLISLRLIKHEDVRAMSFVFLPISIIIGFA